MTEIAQATGSDARPSGARPRKVRSTRVNRLLVLGIIVTLAVAVGLLAAIVLTLSGSEDRVVTLAERNVIAAEAALKDDPKSIDLRLAAARANLAAGNWDRAALYADQVLAKEKGLGDALIIKADALAGKGDTKTAAALYDQIIKSNQPTALQAHVGMAALARKSEDLDKAAEHLRAALAINETDASLMAALGEVELGRGQTEEARQWFARATILVPDLEAAVQGLEGMEYGPAKYDLALLAYNEGNTAEAMRLMEEALQISPEVSWLHVAMGDLLALEEDVAAARAAYEKAIALDPENEDARAALAELE